LLLGKLQGVDANPIFGMTETEKQEYLANVEMCLKEEILEITTWSGGKNIFHWPSGETRMNNLIYGQIEENGTSDIVIGSSDHFLRKYGQSTSSYITYITPDKSLGSPAGEYFDLNSRFRVKVVNDKNQAEMIRGILRYPLYAEKETILNEKTENYDWCVNNGYQTAN